MKTFFVSSTFRDMDEERDAIQQITLPRLNAVARTYGESVSFCDLRWGVDTTSLESDEGSRKVLDVCLDEIDRCRPPIVVILGYRYGWVPPEGLIREAVQRRRLSLDNLEKSITALEIEYGALSGTAASRTLFYFREFDGDIPVHCASEDPEHFALLKQLKERILRLSGSRVKTYHVHWNGQNLEGVDDFAALLAQDLQALMLPQWERFSQLTRRERELRTHQDYLQSKASMFYARSAFAEEIVKRFKNGEKRLILQDGPGSGKSTFSAHLALRFQEEGFTVLPLFAGLTSESCTAADILKKIVYFLEEALELSHPLEQPADAPSSEKGWQQRLNELCLLCREKENLRLLILVDAIDQLAPDQLRDSLLFVPQELSLSLRLILTCLEGFSLKNTNVRSHPFPPFEQAEKEDMIRAVLNAHHRELSPPVINAMAALPQSDNPLYVSLLIQRMLMMNRQDFDRIRSLGDGINAIIAHQLELLDSCPAELDQLCAALLQLAGARINPRLVSRAAQLLAASRRGLRMEDLQKLLGSDFNMLDFSHFVTYMSDSFILRNDGRYDFSHRSIRDGCLKSCKDLQSLHHLLIRHFLSLEEEDPLRKTEIVYHMAVGNAGQEFVSYIEQCKSRGDADAINAALSALLETLKTGRQKPSWLLGLIQNAESYGGGPEFLRFLIWDFRSQSSGSLQDESLLSWILPEAVKFAERLQARGLSLEREYAKAIYFLPQSLETVHGQRRDNSRFSVLTCLLSLYLFRRLRLKNPSALSRMDEARACMALARSYYHNFTGGEKKALYYIDQAVSLAAEAMEEKETRSGLLFLSDCYSWRASIVSLSFSSSIGCAAALEDEKKNLACIQRICEIFPETDNRRAHCIAYQSIGNTLTRIGGSQNASNLQGALNYYEKAYALACELDRENRDLDSCRQQAQCCEEMSDILASLNRKKYSKRILENCSRALGLRSRIMGALNTDGSRKNLGAVLARLGKHRLLCDPTPDSLKTSVSDLKWAIHFYRNLPDLDGISDVGEILQKKQKSLATSLTPIYYRLSDALRSLKQADESAAIRQCAEQLHRLCVSDEQAWAYAEILEIMRTLFGLQSRWVPYYISNSFFDFRDRQYRSHLSPAIPLENQTLSRKTTALLAMLTTSYWTDDQEERSELVSVFETNEEKYLSRFKALDVQTLMEHGNRLRERDPKEAFQCYRHAAAKGDEEAQFLVAECLWNGTGVDINFEKSLEGLRHLAEEGSPGASVKAAARLGLRLTEYCFYEDGIFWLKKAAEQGDRKACERLIRIYESGEGGLPDEEQAAFWREKAEEFRIARKEAFLARVRERRTRREAEKRAEQTPESAPENTQPDALTDIQPDTPDSLTDTQTDIPNDLADTQTDIPNDLADTQTDTPADAQSNTPNEVPADAQSSREQR